MTYKTKATVCSEIHTKTLDTQQAPCRIFEC